MKRRGLAALLGVLTWFIGGGDLHAQSRWLTGYLQTVPLWTESTQFSESNTASFNRFRLTSEPALDDARLSFELAYEHLATFSVKPSTVLSGREFLRGSNIEIVPSGGEWLKLQWTIAEEDHALWQHRFDRFQAAWRPTGGLEVSVGRQAVSWGTTLILTPADPFSPFDPSNPFREFRGGVDAMRVRVYPSPLSEIDVVVRPTRTTVGEELTALARWLGTWNSWELSTWGGSLYGDVAWAFGTVGSVGRWAIRGEAVVREVDDSVVFRGTVGVDRLFQVANRDLLLAAEYQRDGLGAAGPDEYLDVFFSVPFLRGELQALGRDETAMQMSYQLHPLWSVAGLWLWNVNDPSALIVPSFAYSLSNEASLTGGVWLGIGDDQSTVARPLPSEYGVGGTTAYVSLTWFF